MKSRSSAVVNALHSAISTAWVDSELSAGQFADARHGARLNSLVHSMAESIGRSIPLACEDWANTKAAYRLFSNERISDKEILSGHLAATSGRVSAGDGPVLVLHDTTEFTFKRGDTQAVGWPSDHKNGAGKGRVAVRRHTEHSVFMHAGLVVTPRGLPLGLAAVRLWTRPEKSLRKSLSARELQARPAEQKESYRWLENLRESTQRLGPGNCIHVGDREADMLALFNAAQDLDTHFLVRITGKRATDEQGASVDSVMKKVPVAGTRHVTFKDVKGTTHTAELQVRFCRMTLVRSKHKRKDCPPVEATIIYASEKAKPEGRARLDWKLVTNLDVSSLADATEKLDWYAMRWKIEIFHKILKSGCNVEESKLQTTHRLTNLIAVSCIVAWRVFWMTMINRSQKSVPAHLVLTELEMRILDRRVKDRKPPGCKDLAYYINKIARLGGYLDRANDPPPGNVVMWRGLSKLADIVIGAEIGTGLVGN